MTLKEYQDAAMTTCLREAENFTYMMLNLTSEVGEFAGKVAKAIRKGQIKMGKDAQIHFAIYVPSDETVKQWDDLAKEAGDILWQLAGLCSVMGWSLEDIAKQNLDKLADRKARKLIDGIGDNR